MRSVLLLLVSVTAAPAAILPTADSSPYAVSIQQAAALLKAKRPLDAVSVLTKALQQAMSQHETAWAGIIQGNLGVAYHRQGNYREAEEALHSSLRSMASAGRGDGTETAPIMGNLGSLYYEAGRFSESERLLLRSIKMLEPGTGEPQLMGTLLNNLGAVYLAEHKNELAQQTGERALEVLSVHDVAASATAAYSYSILGEASRRLGRQPEAEAFLVRALDIWQKTAGPDDLQTAKGLANLGVFYVNDGEVQKAEPLFRRASDIFNTSAAADTFRLYFLAVYAKFEKQLGHKKEAKGLKKQLNRLAAGSAEEQIAQNVIDARAFTPAP